MSNTNSQSYTYYSSSPGDLTPTNSRRSRGSNQAAYHGAQAGHQGDTAQFPRASPQGYNPNLMGMGHQFGSGSQLTGHPTSGTGLSGNNCQLGTSTRNHPSQARSSSSNGTGTYPNGNTYSSGSGPSYTTGSTYPTANDYPYSNNNYSSTTPRTSSTSRTPNRHAAGGTVAAWNDGTYVPGTQASVYKNPNDAYPFTQRRG